MTVYVFDWPRPPLTANQRLHWRARAVLTAEVRGTAGIAVSGFPKSDRVDVTLTWVVGDKRRRDADNIVPTLKAICDGIVDAGVVPDDTPDLIVKHMPVIRYEPGVRAHMVLEVVAL